jgi:hypothetical protein
MGKASRMAQGSDPDGFLEHYWRGLGLSARNNSLAYGFSVAITAGFGVLDRLAGSPSVPDIFLFAAGACLPFAVLNPTVTKGFRRRVEREPPMVVALGTTFSIVSASTGLAAAALLGWALDGWLAWLLGALAASTVYLLTAALEIALGRGVHAVAGTENLEER